MNVFSDPWLLIAWSFYINDHIADDVPMRFSFILGVIPVPMSNYIYD